MPYDTADARRRGIFLPAAIVAWPGSFLVTVLGQDAIEPGFDSVTLTIPLGPGEHKFARLKMSP